MSPAHYGCVGDVGLGLGHPHGLDSTQPICLRKLRQLSWRKLLSTAHVRSTYMRDMETGSSEICLEETENKKIFAQKNQRVFGLWNQFQF